MRFLSTLPQDDLAEVPPAARAAEAAGYDGLVTSENKNDIRRIPSVFVGFDTRW